MAGIAPLAGSGSTPASSPIAEPSTKPVVSPAPPSSAAADTGSFTAFPSSYEGFGSGGSSFGTVSVVGGKLGVTSEAAPAAPPAVQTPAKAPVVAKQPDANAAAATQTEEPVTVQAPDAKAATPPPAPAPAAVQAAPSAPPAVVVSAAKTDDARQADQASHPGSSQPEQPATTAAALNAESGTAPKTALPTGAPEPPSLGEASANAPLQPVGQSESNPTQGLVGSSSAPIPGTPVASAAPEPPLPAPQFLGSPATNPIVIQAENQQRAAAAEAQAQNQAADAARQADQIALQQINARIAAARATGNDAAAAQLAPKQTQVIGDLQGQTFAGLGQTPPQPFARPEIPTVFLNIAS